MKRSPASPGIRYKGGECVNVFEAFLVAVMASVVSDYINKWFDSINKR